MCVCICSQAINGASVSDLSTPVRGEQRPCRAPLLPSGLASGGLDTAAPPTGVPGVRGGTEGGGGLAGGGEGQAGETGEQRGEQRGGGGETGKSAGMRRQMELFSNKADIRSGSRPGQDNSVIIFV